MSAPLDLDDLNLDGAPWSVLDDGAGGFALVGADDVVIAKDVNPDFGHTLFSVPALAAELREARQKVADLFHNLNVQEEETARLARSHEAQLSDLHLLASPHDPAPEGALWVEPCTLRQGHVLSCIKDSIHGLRSENARLREALEAVTAQWREYEDHTGPICKFEGRPMIHAFTLEELAELATAALGGAE